MASPEQHNEPQTDAGPRALAARAPIGIAELDREGRVVWANDVLAAHLVPGRDPGDAVGTDAFAFVHPDDRPQLARVLDTSTDLAVRCRTVAPAMAGLVNVRFTPLPGSGGDARIGMYVEDASAHDRRLARAITVSSERYVTLLQHVRDAITVVDENGVIVANLGIAETLLGWDPNAWIGRSIFDFAHPDEEAEIRAAFEALLRVPGVPVMRDYRARQADGTFAWIHFTAINLLQDPEVGAVILVTRNVSRERTAAALQAAQAEVFEAIAKGVGLHEVLAKLTEILETFVARCWASVWTIDDDRVQPWVSSLPAALVERLSGREVGGLRGAFAVVRQTGEPVAAADVTSSPWYAGFADELVSAGVRAVAAFPVRDPERGVIDGVVGVHLADGRELTEFERAVAEGVARLTEIALQRHRTELELSRLAHYDKLTGLPNRALLQDRLDDAIQLARHHATSLAVMFCDMDNFKIVNDSLGHAAGDQILVGFAERLRKLLRPSDTIGRFGGDEFVVLLENVAGASDAIQVAERLLDDLRRPFQISDNTVFLTVSIGIALSHGGRGSGEMLLRDADSAMYQAKDRGRSRIEIYDAGLPERAAARLHLESDLRSALDQEQFRLLWQPKVSLAAGRIVSAEALVRWNHPERGTVLPAEFVHIAEETELIREVGEWVLERAIGEHARWLDRFGDDAPECIAVNVSALQLTAPSAVDTVVRVLERFGLPARRLMLELTESVLMAEGSDAAQLLLRLRDLGVRIAIDDFGTGYSSLSYLHQYPVDAVKLDRSFVTGIRADGEGSPIARAVINMAHALGISVTAEGVETPDQLDGLRALGCDWVQGYLLGRPMTADEFSAVLARRPRFDPGTRLPLGPG